MPERRPINLPQRCRRATLVLLLPVLLLCGCATTSPWVAVPAGEQIHSMQDVPLGRVHQHPEAYVGAVFEDQFKFYRIYHSREDADPGRRGQVILGKTHFTARPVSQYLQALQIQITPAQEDWIRRHNIVRQDAIRARVRFVGLAPGDALAFELLEILEVPGHKRSS